MRTALRLQIEAGEARWPQFKIDGMSDIRRINGYELQEYIETAFDQHGEDNVGIITRSTSAPRRSTSRFATASCGARKASKPATG